MSTILPRTSITLLLSLALGCGSSRDGLRGPGADDGGPPLADAGRGPGPDCSGTTDGSWTAGHLPLTSWKRPAEPRAVWGSGTDDVYVIGDGIYHSSDRGGTWQVQRPFDPKELLFDVWGSGPRDVYVATGYGWMLHSSDGLTWSRQRASSLSYLSAVWGSGPQDVYAGGYGGSIIHTSDFGASWSTLVQGSADKWTIEAIWGSGPEDVYAVGYNGTILHTADRGRTWQSRSSGTFGALRGIWGSGPEDIYIAGIEGKGDNTGPGGLLLHSYDRGKTWTLTAVPREPLEAVWGTGPNEVYAAGGLGTWYSISSGGEALAGTRFNLKLGDLSPGTLLGIWGICSEIYVVGAGSFVLHRQ
jgi:photosystem II stability/assembly factor-like uncharacterized protein